MNKSTFIIPNGYGELGEIENGHGSLEAALKDVVTNKDDYFDEYDDVKEVIIYELRPIKKVKIVTGIQEISLNSPIKKSTKKK